MSAVALIAPNVPEAEGIVCVLSEVRELPLPILVFIQRRFPTYQFRYSKTAEARYYANACPRCDVITGDFYLHDEPGAPFFPTDEEAARGLSIELVPVKGPVDLDAAPATGVGELIMEHAKRITRK